jgi:hypothetical protein
VIHAPHSFRPLEGLTHDSTSAANGAFPKRVRFGLAAGASIGVVTDTTTTSFHNRNQEERKRRAKFRRSLVRVGVELDAPNENPR